MEHGVERPPSSPPTSGGLHLLAPYHVGDLFACWVAVLSLEGLVYHVSRLIKSQLPKKVLSCAAEARSSRLILLIFLIADKHFSFTSILCTLSARVTLFLPGALFLFFSCCLFTAISET